jgi:hypothetical protein
VLKLADFTVAGLPMKLLVPTKANPVALDGEEITGPDTDALINVESGSSLPPP